MKDYIRLPKLSTGFSQDGKGAKKRFENIFSTQIKKRGAAVLILVLLASVGAGAMIGYERKETDEPVVNENVSDNQIKRLYDARVKYIGDASANARILGSLPFADGFSVTSMKLKTDKEPYSITVYMDFTGENLEANNLEKMAVLYFLLVENADSISFVIDDEVYTTDRSLIEDTGIYGFNEYDGSYESFEKIYNEVTMESGYKTLEEGVSQEILKYNSGRYLKGECAAEGNIILETEEINGLINVYAFTSYGEYGFENGVFTKVSGTGVIPVKMVFTRYDGDKYMCKGYRKTKGGENYTKSIGYHEPKDGKYYIDSIKGMFPERLWEEVLGDDRNVHKKLVLQECEYAQKYLESIGRKCRIGEVERELSDMNVEASNKLLDMYGEYPYWIGTFEKTENGVRMVYEKQWESRGNGDGTVTYKKYIYDTDKVVEETVIDIKDGEISYIKGKEREEGYSKYH